MAETFRSHTLVLSDRADKRTKERVKQHGAEGFILRSTGAQHTRLFSEPAFLLESVTTHAAGGDPWLGWIPSSHIEDFILRKKHRRFEP